MEETTNEPTKICDYDFAKTRARGLLKEIGIRGGGGGVAAAKHGGENGIVLDE